LHDQGGDWNAGLVSGVMTLGFFVPLAEEPKKISI
jgi:hypothetical protein